jgi:hypothetical protein
MIATRVDAAKLVAIAAAHAEGFRVHQGGPEDPPELQGKWFWSWTNNGCGIDAQVDQSDSEAEAWDAAIVAHANMLMEP